MINLYNKIYKAINEGIQKALLIGPDQNDVSINYSYHKINNNSNLLSFYVKDLLNGNNDAYYDILKYYENTHYMYKANGAQELLDIIIKIKDFAKNINIKWINTENALTFITDDDKELALNEYQNKDKQYVRYIKFHNIENCDHPIIISRYLMIKQDVQWISDIEKNRQLNFNDNDCIINNKNALNDFDGYNHTHYNLNIHNKDDYQNYPALLHCKNISIYNQYEAYLPAAGEILFLTDIDNWNVINNYILLKILHLNEIIPNQYYWSSTEYDKFNAWKPTVDSISKNAKTDEYYVLPCFKKIN